MVSGFAFAKTKEVQQKPNVRYKKSKKIDFEEIIIRGEKQKAEMSVLTGNVGNDGDGLVRYKEDFLDQMALETGEEIE
jgi:hypothetical protein